MTVEQLQEKHTHDLEAILKEKETQSHTHIKKLELLQEHLAVSNNVTDSLKQEYGLKCEQEKSRYLELEQSYEC